MSKTKLELEYIINTSPIILFNCLTTASGLSEWFCDDVNLKDDKFTFSKLASVLIGLVGTLFIIDFTTFFSLDDGNMIELIAKISVIFDQNLIIHILTNYKIIFNI